MTNSDIVGLAGRVKSIAADSRYDIMPSIRALLSESAETILSFKSEIEALREAGRALIADVRRRYPGEELRCEYMRALDATLSGSPEG